MVNPTFNLICDYCLLSCFFFFRPRLTTSRRLVQEPPPSLRRRLCGGRGRFHDSSRPVSCESKRSSPSCVVQTWAESNSRHGIERSIACSNLIERNMQYGPIPTLVRPPPGGAAPPPPTSQVPVYGLLSLRPSLNNVCMVWVSTMDFLAADRLQHYV